MDLLASMCPFEESEQLIEETPNSVDLNSNSNNKSSGFAKEKLATFLRIRPLDNLTIEETPYKIISSNKIYIDEKILSTNNSLKNSNPSKKVYSFTEILDESANQINVFSKCCLPLVEDVLNGTNGFLFCYGTTSSGKSFTMRGPHEDPTIDPGLIPLSLQKIFSSRKFIDEPLIAKSKFCDITLVDQKVQDLEKQFKDSILASPCCRNVTSFDNYNNNIIFNEDGYQYICYLSYFEIYNEFIYDLLNSSSGGRGTALTLFADEKKRYYVKDLRSVMVSSLSEALKIYSFGWTNLQRNIQETGLNKNSSRSHSFLCITLIKFKEDGGKIFQPQISHLTLGDLAGSERQNKTNTEGCRAKEGGKINNSLMYLSNCIRTLKNNQKNSNPMIVPFRDSSLTKFFQPYFIGNGKVAMICNINPSPNLVGETRTTLEFCGHACRININTSLVKPRYSQYSILEEKSPLEDISYLQNKVTYQHELQRLNSENVALKTRCDELEKENAELKAAQEESEKIEVARKASLATSLGLNTLALDGSFQSISSRYHTQEENLIRDALKKSRTEADFSALDDSQFSELGIAYSNAQTQTDDDETQKFKEIIIEELENQRKSNKKLQVLIAKGYMPSLTNESNQGTKKRGRPRKTNEPQGATKATPMVKKKPLGQTNKKSARKSARKSTRILTPDYCPKYVIVDRLARNQANDNTRNDQENYVSPVNYQAGNCSMGLRRKRLTLASNYYDQF